MRITFAQEARTEFAAAIRWYAKEAGPDQAKDFRAEVHQMLTLISEHPAIGAPTICGARHRVLRRFPFSIVYHSAADSLTILAIANHSRRPGYWLGRR
jgi:plasmid stabilization system protein ParE